MPIIKNFFLNLHPKAMAEETRKENTTKRRRRRKRKWEKEGGREEGRKEGREGQVLYQEAHSLYNFLGIK